MNKNIFISLFFILILVTLVSYSVTHAFFKSTGTSTNNVFAAAAQFPTPTNGPTPTPTPIPIAQTLVINEILPHSACKQGQSENQFVEIWNGTSSTVDLKSFKLSDGTNTIAISNSVANLASHAFAILVKDGGLIGNNKCIPDVHGAITPNLGGQVNLDTGLLELLDAGNAVIDTVKWGTQSASLNPAIEQSIERVPLGHDTAFGINFNPTDFIVRETTTPGYGTNIVLNEFVYRPGVTFSTEWVEVYNASNSAVSLNGWSIVDAANNTKSLTSLGTINGLSFKTLDITPEILNNTGSETIFLKDNTSLIIDSHTYTGTNTQDQAIGRQLDAGNIWKTCTTPTKGTTNNGSC